MLPQQPIYCDNAASTQARPEVIQAMIEANELAYANPSSLHSFGGRAKKDLESSRKTIADFINASSEEIYFTKNGTEANNLAIFGLAKQFGKPHPPANEATHPAYTNFGHLPLDKGRHLAMKVPCQGDLGVSKNHIITSKIEHSSVYGPIKNLEEQGYKVTWLDVDEEGFISLEQLKNEISDETFLVSIIHGNNEIGTIQNIEEIGRICREQKVIFHTDAVQSIGKIPVDVEKQNVDILSISAHKFYGPKGIGAIYVRQGVNIDPLMLGGGQEEGLSPGTENTVTAVGFAKALELRAKEMSQDTKRLKEIQEMFFQELGSNNKSLSNKIKINGTQNLDLRIPGNINLSFDELAGDTAVLRLSMKKICASSGSACSSGSIQPSKVISALYESSASEKDKNWATNSIRLSFGLKNTIDEAKYVLEVVKKLAKIN